MKVPNRVKIFAWRAFKNGLPTRRNLKARHIVQEALCEWCTEGEKDVAHALYYCLSVRQSWKHYFLVLMTDDAQLDIIQLALKVMSKRKPEDLDKFFLIAWSMWHRRNHKVFENKILPTDQVIVHALILAKDYKEARFQKQNRKLSSCFSQAPPQNALKLNVDGAAFDTLNRVRVGLILRNTSCEVILVASMQENGVEIELLAILRGLQSAFP
ncbi:hypothetical protein F2P56_002202 [Juglans regia]|uniref:Uncharacterized protein LOC108984830 n=2 Tax=Juglans regia TaxID=51240 RepID=A0A2I4DZ62_JUGRE|nr:uncharacterized protein LOC108984830 [Juglans regia]KAF5481561.1 hypothetical protein F2P56_002202 [Juglans regia]